MKAAFCLSGISRAIPVTYTALKTHFIDKYNCDVFFKSWSITDNSDIYDLSPLKAVELYKPKAWELEFYSEAKYLYETLSLCKGNEELRSEVIRAKRHRVLAMWHNVAKCMSILERYAKDNNIVYDLVIRGRPDGWYLTNFDFNKIEPKTLYILGSKFNDGFAAGDYETMAAYSYLPRALGKYIPKFSMLPINHWLCPHKLLDFHLKELENVGIKIVRLKDNIRAGKIWTNPVITFDTNIEEMIAQYDKQNSFI